MVSFDFSLIVFTQSETILYDDEPHIGQFTTGIKSGIATGILLSIMGLQGCVKPKIENIDNP